jgi:hypothetical protein
VPHARSPPPHLTAHDSHDHTSVFASSEFLLEQKRGDPAAPQGTTTGLAELAGALCSDSRLCLGLVLGLLIVVRFQSIGIALPKRRLGLVDGGGWW